MVYISSHDQQNGYLLNPFALGHISIPNLLHTLRTLGIRSVMAEGGARVIQSFLATPNSVNTIIVTVAPVFVGVQGIGYELKPTAGKVRLFVLFSSSLSYERSLLITRN